MAAKKPVVLTSTGQWQQIQTGDFVPISAGGTGATDAAGARAALGLTIDTDGTMAANSDTVIPSQKAVRTYVAANGGSSGATRYTYANRSNLRTGTPADGAQAVVEALGYFVFYVGSTELDDDESCFVTSNGCWLLEAISWGAMESYVSTVREDIEADLPVIPGMPSAFLYGSLNPGLGTIAAGTQTTFNISVTGALPGDTAFVSPPSAGSKEIAISWFCTTSAVQVVVSNTSVTVSGTAPSGTWRAVVIQQ
jgi:hypothetical protein